MTGRPVRVGELLAAAVPALAYPSLDAPDLGAALPVLPLPDGGEAPVTLRCGCGSYHTYPPGVRAVFCWPSGWWVSRHAEDEWRTRPLSLFERLAASMKGGRLGH